MDTFTERYPMLKSCKAEIECAEKLLTDCFVSGGKLLICGNGGSAADSGHIVGELMKGFLLKRELSEETKEKIRRRFPEDAGFLCDNLQGALPAISLCAHAELMTAFENDVRPDMVYAQQVLGYGKEGDVLLAITTSGNSKNILYAMTAAKAKGLRTIGLTGRDGGMLAKAADVAIIVPEEETYKIQELHLPVYHALCLMLEERFFRE